MKTCKNCGRSVRRGGGMRGGKVKECLVCLTARVLGKKGRAQ